MNSVMKRTKWPIIIFTGILISFELIDGTVTTAFAFIFSNPDRVVEGKILYSKVAFIPRGTRAHNVRYSYQVEGRYYESRMINYLGRTSKPRETVEMYPQGKIVQVFYDSSSPSMSVLNRTELGIDIYLGFIKAIVIALIPVLYRVLFSAGKGITKTSEKCT
ncbi:DUF3592 domain-containing protein [Zhongshania sp. BJYM1]|uniref:DUF3592 domain-containing protein n=1 Tax=Zhongshania aquatica TaxID=2965069 RepID=UPI0022B445EE|nr:DUF3592 domain-containing protein [Marortus sp. BJYM1]